MAYDETVNGFPYFSQNDSRWSSVLYGGGNIGSSGCGPTSAAMVLKSYGFDVTPENAAVLFINTMGGRKTTDGSVCFPALGKSPYNLTVKNSKNINDVVTALKSGIPVVANPHGPCDFTAGGHYIVLCGINGSNQIRVNDPNGNHYEMSKTKTWSSEYIEDCCISNNCIDGFWIISKNGAGITSGTSVKATEFQKYSLSESAIIDIAKCVTGEQGGDDLLACKQEASQMANLNEVTYGRSNTEDNILKTIHGGWYSSDSWTRGYTQTAVDAVRSVLVEGKRVLPRYVTEHDMFPLDAAISGHWNNGDSEDRTQYIKGSTTIKQNPSRFDGGGSSYTFYCFFGSDKDKDVAGYYNKDYIEYKSDIPYGANGEEYLYSENSYSDTETEPTVVWNNRVAENIHEKLQNTDVIEPTGELEIYVSGNKITNIVGNLSWKNSIYELSTTMSFETPKPIGAYIEDLIYSPEVGDIVQQVTNAEIFRGVITKIDDGDSFVNKCDVVDLGWYLNKTQQTYQFKNITASEAIRELCEDLSINIVMLPELVANINEIYFDKTISDIITDILDKCSGDYNYDFVPDGLRIYEIGELTAYPEFTVASNIPEVYSPDYRGEVNHSLSIEDMKNSIKVTSEKDNVYTELKVLQNRDLIDKYGFLQEIVKIDTEKENADTVAAEKLKELGKVGESFAFTIIEKYDSYTRAGEVITVDGVNYVIESTDHSFKGGRHYNKMELKKV